jgi:hypothetical protein
VFYESKANKQRYSLEGANSFARRLRRRALLSFFNTPKTPLPKNKIQSILNPHKSGMKFSHGENQNCLNADDFCKLLKARKGYHHGETIERNF